MKDNSTIVQEVKSVQVFVSDIPVSIYLMSDGNFYVSMSQASRAVGLQDNWLSRAVAKEGKTIDELRNYGFQGEILTLENDLNLIPANDFMAVIMYAALSLTCKPAIDLLAKFSRITLEYLANSAFRTDFSDEQENIEFSADSFRQSWEQAKTGATLPLSELWEGIEDD